MRDLKQRDTAETIEFFDMAYRTIKILFAHIIDTRDERLDPAMTLFDGLFLKPFFSLTPGYAGESIQMKFVKIPLLEAKL